jgi:hypothetical protein
MWDSLIEQDPKMKQIRAESRTEGEVRASQRMVLDLIEVRFPQLSETAKQSVKRIKKLEALRQLGRQLAVAPDEATARQVLSSYAA